MTSDSELVHRAGAGEPQAFGVLYDRYAEKIYRYIYFRVARLEVAEDLTEAVFLKAWEALPGLRGEGLKFRPWLYRIAHNLVIDHYRSRRSELPLEHAEFLSAPGPLPEQQLERQERAERLLAALQRLAPQYRQVIACRFVGGLSHAETARVLGLKEGHVRVLQHRALKLLRQLLEG